MPEDRPDADIGFERYVHANPLRAIFGNESETLDDALIEERVECAEFGTDSSRV